MNLIAYKILSCMMILYIVVVVGLLTVQKWQLAIVVASVFIFSLVLQVFLVRCRNCGTRPGLWLLAVWTLLLDFELYFSDTILLKRCPKCGSDLTRQGMA